MAKRRTAKEIFEGFVQGTAQGVRQFFASAPEAQSAELRRGGMPSSDKAGLPYNLASQFGYDGLAQHLRIDQDLQARYSDYEEMDEYPEISCLTRDSEVAIPVFHKEDRMSIADIEMVSLGEIAARREQYPDEPLYVFAMDLKRRKIVPAEAKGPVKTGSNRQVVKVTFSESRSSPGRGKREWSIRCTPDHLFMSREGHYVPAADLGPGDRLMPMATKVAKNGYLQVRSPWDIAGSGSPVWRMAHRVVAEELVQKGPVPKSHVVHHEDEDKTNPHPANLKVESRAKHTHIHAIAREPETRKKIGDALKARWDDPAERAKLSEAQRESHRKRGRGGSWRNPDKGVMPESHRAKIREAHKSKKVPLSKDVVEAAVRSARSLNEAAKKLGVSWNTLRRRGEEYGLDLYGILGAARPPKEYEKEGGNHVVVSVEYDGFDDVYDIEVPGYHNFACEGVFVHNCALDIYADDATIPNLEKGRSVWVTSENDKISKELDTMLHKRLLVEDDAWGLARTVSKYGNAFSEVLLSDKGVIGLNFLPPPTVRRIEGPRGQLLGFVQDVKGEFNISLEDFYKLAAQRGTEAERNRGPGEMTVFEDWEVVHWRLRGKHLRSVYGHGVIDPARWIWKRLALLEDALLIYKLSRAPSRYAFYVDIGELDGERGLAYVNRVKNQFVKKKFVNPATGKLDMRYNPLCLAGDAVVRLLDGSAATVKDMVVAHDAGEEQWVWGSDLEDSGRSRPVKVEWAGKTRRDARLVRVTLDNGRSIRVTPDHKMIRRNGDKVQAQDLVPGDSLMPFRRRISKVVSVEWLEDTEDTYTLTVNPCHTFGLDVGIFVCNSHDEDFFIPSKGGNDSTRIETLQGPDYAETDTVEYHRDKLVSALKIPKPYMGYGGEATRGSLSSEDIRFARTVMRIQREIRGGLRKVCRIHLIAKGIDPDKHEFDVQMSVPSSILELAKLEVLSATADLAERMRETVSTKWILTSLFKFTEEEAERLMKERDKEQLGKAGVEAKVQKTIAKATEPEPEPAPAPGGGGEAPPEGEGEAGKSEPELTQFDHAPRSYDPLLERRLRKVLDEHHRSWDRRYDSKMGPMKRVEEKLGRLMREDSKTAKRLRNLEGLLTEVKHSMRPDHT